MDEILAEHVRILKGADALEAIAVGPRPDAVDGLAHRRWALTRDMMLHFSRMESAVFAPLAVDVRPRAVERARAASAAVARFVTDFHHYAQRWQGFPTAAGWAEYGAAVSRFVEEVRELIDRLAVEIIPLLPAQPSGSPVPLAGDRYASDAWDIRALIFSGDQSPKQ